jgi:hypothetical protein
MPGEEEGVSLECIRGAGGGGGNGEGEVGDGGGVGGVAVIGVGIVAFFLRWFIFSL